MSKPLTDKQKRDGDFIAKLERLVEDFKEGRAVLRNYRQDPVTQAVNSYSLKIVPTGPITFEITYSYLNDKDKEDNSNATPEQINNCDYLRSIYGEQS